MIFYAIYDCHVPLALGMRYVAFSSWAAKLEAGDAY
jgi:hypothetical protein